MADYIFPSQLDARYILLDNFSFIAARDIIQDPKPSLDEIRPGATLLESIVLYDKLALDPLANGFSKNLIHDLKDIHDKDEKDLSLSEKLLLRFGTLPQPKGGYVENHYEVVEEVVDQIPEDIVQYLELPIKDKITILESTRVCFPKLGFSWEWYLKRFSDEQSTMDAGNIESAFITATIYDLADFMPPTIRPVMDDSTNSINLSSELGLFRKSGAISKQAYYLALAGCLNIPYVPNYERNMFYKAYFSAHQDPVLAKNILDKNFHSKSPDILNAQSQVIDYFNQEVIRKLNQEYLDDVFPWNAISYDIPPLLNRIYSLSKEKGCSPLTAALKIRNSSSAVAFRKWCVEISEAYYERDIKELRKLMKGFRETCELWSRNLEEPTTTSKLVVSIPSILSYETEVPDIISRFRRKYSKPIIFLRELL